MSVKYTHDEKNLRLGKFIVVEGLEGAGKTTAVQTIKHYLDILAVNTIITREPGGTFVGELIRKIIKEKTAEILDPYCELLLFYAARVQLLKQVIYPALAAGTWVITDRFELSTFAYQGGGRGIPLADLTTLSKLCLNNFQPDLIIFLDLPPEHGLLRAKQRNNLDRIEQESLTFFRDIYTTYKQLIVGMANVNCIDASQPLEVVQDQIFIQLKSFCQQVLGSQRII